MGITTTGKLQYTINGVSVPSTKLALTGNAAVDAANLATTANVDLASAAGLVMTATDGYDSYNTVSLIDYPNNATTSSDERYTTAQLTAASTDTGTVFETGREDEFTLTVTAANGASNSATASKSLPLYSLASSNKSEGISTSLKVIP